MCLFCSLELTEMQKVNLCLHISKTYGKYWNEQLNKWCDICSFDKYPPKVDDVPISNNCAS